MKAGVVMGTCIEHGMQNEAWASIRRYSHASTEVVAVLNGEHAPKAPTLPFGVEKMRREAAFTEEADLWQYGFDLALSRGWDWCVFLHDDFALTESCVGWEEELGLLDNWRIALATWTSSENITRDAEPWNHEPTRPGQLRCTLDPCSIAFRMSVFAPRGCFTDLRSSRREYIMYGYAAYEAAGWALSQDYAIWQLKGSTDHNWLEANTRYLLGFGAGGQRATAVKYAGVAFPAEHIDMQHIKIIDRIVRIAPETL